MIPVLVNTICSHHMGSVSERLSMSPADIYEDCGYKRSMERPDKYPSSPEGLHSLTFTSSTARWRHVTNIPPSDDGHRRRETIGRDPRSFENGIAIVGEVDVLNYSVFWHRWADFVHRASAAAEELNTGKWTMPRKRAKQSPRSIPSHRACRGCYLFLFHWIRSNRLDRTKTLARTRQPAA